MKFPFSLRGPESPVARGVEALRQTFPRLRGVRPATIVVSLLIGLGIVALLAFVQVSSTPQFCGTCHIMKPYYRSWQHSKHNRIACVECHISPGITAEVRKKYEALSMVAKYFTGTYGTRPWGEVDDAACLRCHQRRLLEGKVDFHGVIFDHRPHLTETRRGIRLRCTSCHSQIVQGAHLVVTVSTCTLCHFKDQPANQGLGACRRCHEVPDHVVTNAGVPFDHSQVKRLDMPCSSCHGGVVRGQGEVARERCLTCHNQTERLVKFGETAFLHQMHVTKHKVDCQGCHAEIEHGSMRLAGAAAVAAAAAGAPVGGAATGPPNPCETCHGTGHNPQEQLYSGTGGRGVKSIPSPMYLTGVRCEGCHNAAFSVQVAAIDAGDTAGPHSMPAGVVSCMACHGPAYKRIYAAWKDAVDGRTAALERQLTATLPAMGMDPPQAWDDARHNFNLVSKGHGVHNINYSYVLLDKAFDQMNDARRQKGLAALSRPWETMPASSCLSCHLGIESQAGEFGGRRFAHAPHVVDAKLGCENCHRTHAERPKIEVVRYGPEGCTSCHHRNLTGTSFGQCGRCHADPRRGTVPSFRGEFSHEAHLKNVTECASCHDLKNGDPRPSPSACAECHN